MNLLPEYSLSTLDTVHCMDALTLLRGLPSASVDCVISDPPYGNNNGVNDLAGNRAVHKVRGGRQSGVIIPIANDTNAQWELLMPSLIREINRVLKPVSCCCCFCCGGGPNIQFAKLASWLDEYHSFFQAIVWDKSKRGDGMGWRYRRNYEFVMVSYKKGGQLSWNGKRKSRPNVMKFRPVLNKDHENKKPLALIHELIENHSNPGDIILDPFIGSGTTAVAARNLGRHFIGCDISPEYVAIARKRLAQPFTLPMFAGVD